MSFSNEIACYHPVNEQEKQDQRVMTEYIRSIGKGALQRENHIAHITSSGFLLNPAGDKTLLIYHKQRNTWAWTGGHADGEENLLSAALKEAREETGACCIKPLFTQIASLDIFPVAGHSKNGCYVNPHLHLSVGFCLICEEGQNFCLCETEATALRWFSFDELTRKNFTAADIYLYQKLINSSRRYAASI